MRKKGATVFASFLFTVLLVAFREEYVESHNTDVVPSASNETPIEEPKEVYADDKKEAEKESVSGYTIVQTGSMDLGFETRYEYWVVPNNIFLSENDIQSIASEIIEKAKTEESYEAIDVFFIDDERQVHNGFTIARVSFERPDLNVYIGDYQEYTYSSQMGSNESEMLPRDYPEGTYPTKEELDIYFYWLELVKKGTNEEEALLLTATKYELNPKEAEQLIEKVRSR